MDSDGTWDCFFITDFQLMKVVILSPIQESDHSSLLCFAINQPSDQAQFRMQTLDYNFAGCLVWNDSMLRAGVFINIGNEHCLVFLKSVFWP